MKSFFWFVFPCMQSKYRKIRTRENFALGHFLHSDLQLEGVSGGLFENNVFFAFELSE